MHRRLGLLALLAGVLTLVALPAGAQVRSHDVVRVDVENPNLHAVLQQIEDAEDHEYDADDAPKSLVSFAVGFGTGELSDAINLHLIPAIASVNAAESAGEIDAADADALRADLNAAIGADGTTITLLAKGDLAGAAKAYKLAEDAKEAAEDIIYDYPVDESADLGCKLYLSSNPFPGDTTVGVDGCKVPLSGFQIDGGYDFNRVSKAQTGSEQYPCEQGPLKNVVICSVRVEPGGEPYVSVDTSAEKTQNYFIVRAVDGRVQVFPFTVGSREPTADLLGVATLRWSTSRGFKPVDKLEQGARYNFNLGVTNNGPGAAFDGKVQVTFSPTFVPEFVSKRCALSGTTVTCPLDDVRPFEGISVSILGRPMKAGPISFDWNLTTSAKKPTPDKTPNSGSIKKNVFAVPGVMIKKILSPVKLGKPGTISGIAASNVKKVQVGILQVPANPPVHCAWLGKNSKLKKVAPYGGACDKGIWLDVKGTQKWELNVKLGLPPGSYYVLGRGTSTDGITGTIFKMSDWSLDTFNVKGK